MSGSVLERTGRGEDSPRVARFLGFLASGGGGDAAGSWDEPVAHPAAADNELGAAFASRALGGLGFRQENHWDRRRERHWDGIGDSGG